MHYTVVHCVLDTGGITAAAAAAAAAAATAAAAAAAAFAEQPKPLCIVAGRFLRYNGPARH
jgi:hypothetical protein